MIELRGVGKVYGKKDHTFTALDEVSFMIEKGSSVAIVGKSGSGKSTLMHCMSGLDRMTSGEIIIDGESLGKMSQKTIDRFRANKIGFIFQSFFVQGNETCAQNVALPLEIAQLSMVTRKKRVDQALEVVGLSDKRDEKAKNLSGGQKQRLAVARAIVTKPSIIFADEPTGNLDSQTGEQIEKLLFSLNKSTKATLIIVTHDEELAARCQRQIVIKDGHVLSDSMAAGATPRRRPVARRNS